MSAINTYGEWFQVDVGSNEQINQYGFANGGPDKEVGSWTLSGSTDQTSWYAIDIRNQVTTNHNSYSIYTPNGDNAGNSYRYFRFIVQGLLSQPYIMGQTIQFKMFLKNSTNTYLQSFYSSASENLGNGAISITLGTSSTFQYPTYELGAGPSGPGYYYGTNNTYTGPVYTPVLGISNPPDAPTSVAWVDNYNGNITISFTPGADNGSSIINYSYSLDNGANFTELDPAQATSPLTISGLTNRTNYTLVLQAINGKGAGTSSDPLSLYYMCFLEGTKILCYDSVLNQEIERHVESLRKGDLVKTTMDGYKAIDTIGTSKIYNPSNSMRSKNRLYKCSKENYSELTEDLVITGCHAVLVKDLSDEERRDLIDIQGKVYITEDYYRLIACVDKRAQPYEKEGLFNIWHFALENDNYYFNYGIYANGLKVETASKRMMKEMSGMNLIQ